MSFSLCALPNLSLAFMKHMQLCLSCLCVLLQGEVWPDQDGTSCAPAPRNRRPKWCRCLHAVSQAHTMHYYSWHFCTLEGLCQQMMFGASSGNGYSSGAWPVGSASHRSVQEEIPRAKNSQIMKGIPEEKTRKLERVGRHVGILLVQTFYALLWAWPRVPRTGGSDLPTQKRNKWVINWSMPITWISMA